MTLSRDILILKPSIPNLCKEGCLFKIQTSLLITVSEILNRVGSSVSIH